MTDSKENKVSRIAFTGTLAYRKMLAREAQDRDIKVQGLLEQAVAGFLASKSSSTDGHAHPLIPSHKLSRSPDSDIDSLVLQMPKEIGPWVDSLLQILRSGHLIAIEAIQRNLVAFKELVALASEHENPVDSGKAGGSAGRLPGGNVARIRDRARNYKSAYESEAPNIKRPGHASPGSGPAQKRDGFPNAGSTGKRSKDDS